MKRLLLLSLCLALAAVVNLRQEDPLKPGGAAKLRAWCDAVTLQKADNLAYDYAAHYPPGSHQAKMNYRLLPPVVAWLIGVDGLRVVELTSWLMLGACIFIALARASSARAAFAGTLATLCTSSGAVYFNDLGHCCDVMAQALLAVNLVVMSPWLMAGTATLALFTDERALLILPVLFALRGPKAWPLWASVAVYAAGRLALGHWLYAPTSYADVGCWDYALAELRLLPVVTWGMLEGAWMMLGVTVVALWRRNRALAAAVALYPFAVACLSLTVLDMTRSASYAILVPAAALMLAKLPERRAFWVCLAGAVVSVTCPNSMFIAGFIETFK